MINNTSFIKHIPGIIAIKDISSVYLDVSELTAQLLGWKYSEDCLDKTDYDIPCEASKFASSFVEQDKKVIHSKNPLIALDIQHYKLGWKTLIANKKFLDNSSEACARLMVQCVDISNTILARYYYNLFQLDSKKFLNKNNYGATYILNSDHCPMALTEKQEICLFFLIRGKSIKEIALFLKISPRTVEDHVERIKDKFGCKTKKEIIEKAIDKGFLYYIPPLFKP